MRYPLLRDPMSDVRQGHVDSDLGRGFRRCFVLGTAPGDKKRQGQP
jgi:hypothetical protein